MNNNSHILKPDAKAILLLCGRFGSNEDRDAKPLTLTQYNKLAKWLKNNDMRPADLLKKRGQDRLSAFGEKGKLTKGRINSLLNRGTAMALFIEEWANKGGWVLARSDTHYPSRFRKRLRHKAPPVIYGVGDQELLEQGGVSMVGSRDSDDESLSFVRGLAQRCAKEGVTVVSGGARGVDQTAMDTALEAGGLVVGALAGGLAKASRNKKYRRPITEKRLTLMSAFHPDAGFHVGNAMARNKHIYSMGDGTVVAHSTEGSGGTWSGATENIKYNWVPLFVRADPSMPKGNKRLIEMGAYPIDHRVIEKYRIEDWLYEPAILDDSGQAGGQYAGQSSLFDDRNSDVRNEADILGEPEGKDGRELFPLVWPTIKGLLKEPRSEQDIREHFEDLHLGQARDWLKTAVNRGLAVREEHPVRYSLSDEDNS